MGYRICEECEQGFHQHGRGRPAKRCPDCRGEDRYGPVHRALKARAGLAVGHLCTRCQKPIRPDQPVEPDHTDGGGPTDYAGWAHASCNHSAGAAYGNRLRAQAYRAAKGLPEPANGNGSVAVVVREPQPPPCPLVDMPRDRTQPGKCTCDLGRWRCW